MPAASLKASIFCFYFYSRQQKMESRLQKWIRKQMESLGQFVSAVLKKNSRGRNLVFCSRIVFPRRGVRSICAVITAYSTHICMRMCSYRRVCAASTRTCATICKFSLRASSGSAPVTPHPRRHVGKSMLPQFVFVPRLCLMAGRRFRPPKMHHLLAKPHS